jgi:SAM-dependent methyltransferase
MDDWGTEVVDVPDRATWIAVDQVRRPTRQQCENALIRLPFPSYLNGFCACCGSVQSMEVSARHGFIGSDGSVNLALSEALVCPSCRINSRMRFACELLNVEISNTAEKRIYLTEKKTHLFRALERREINCLGSEWLGADKTPGETYDGIEHQDVHKLTYASGSFDVSMCLDVMEHIDNPLGAMSELYRVTKPGGLCIVTFPFYCDRDQTVIRSSIASNGEIEYHLPAEYHGNPLGGGALVFRELSWDFIEAVRNLLGSAVRHVNYWSVHRAHFGRSRFAVLIRK